RCGRGRHAGGRRRRRLRGGRVRTADRDVRDERRRTQRAPLKAAPGEFPWDTVMAVGFGLLRLSPKTFWAMTPREMERAMSVYAPPRGPDRAMLDAMMDEFPDG